MGEWTWINFKYERLSSFCFVCGILGHQERECSIVYAHPDKEITRAYGTWLRAPGKTGRNMNVGAKWLRNGHETGKGGEADIGSERTETTIHGRGNVDVRFMEVDGRITEITGEIGSINVVPRNQEVSLDRNQSGGYDGINDEGRENFENITVVNDPKRRRVDQANVLDKEIGNSVNGLINIDESKNL